MLARRLAFPLLDACYFGLLKHVLAPLVVAVGASACWGCWPSGEMENGTRLDIVDAQTQIIEERVASSSPRRSRR